MVMIENIHHGEYLEQSKVIRELNVTAIDTIESVYTRGVAEGVFRKGLDPIELHWQISALCFFNVSNRATFSKIFGRDLGAPKALASLRDNVGRDGAALRRAAARARQVATEAASPVGATASLRHERTSSYILLLGRSTMKTSIATVSISGDLAEKLEAIAAAGFDGVEIFENDFLPSARSPAEVGRMVRDLGLEITLFQPFRDFEGMPEPQRAPRLRPRRAQVRRDAGARHRPDAGLLERVAAGARRHRPRRRRLPRAWRARRRRAACASATRRWPGDGTSTTTAMPGRSCAAPTIRTIGLILDSFHTLARRIDLDSIRSIPGDKDLHRAARRRAADRHGPALLEPPLPQHAGRGRPAGRDFMRAVAATGYDGPLSLEIFNDQFRGGSPKAIAVDGQPLAGLPDGPGARAPSPASRSPVPADARPRSRSRASSSSSSPPTKPKRRRARRACLTALGFAQAGRHAPRTSTLYRQGDINIVINTEREGFAHSSYVTHGTSAYAIGLKVDDAAAPSSAPRRSARRLRAAGRPRASSRIPAIRGVGGGVIYFLDDHASSAGSGTSSSSPMTAPGRRHAGPDRASTTSRRR